MDVRRWLGEERWRVMGLWMLIWIERVREMWFVGLREVIVVEDAADGVRGRKGGLRGENRIPRGG